LATFSHGHAQPAENALPASVKSAKMQSNKLLERKKLRAISEERIAGNRIRRSEFKFRKILVFWLTR